MAIGVMEVTLVDARGLSNTEFLENKLNSKDSKQFNVTACIAAYEYDVGGGIDPYVLIQYKGQERKSSVARGQGGTPVWNEKFTFRAEYPGSGDRYKLVLKIMDHDTFSNDDHVGEATIYLKELLESGVEKGSAELHPCKYSVVDSSQSYRGEIRVGVSFTAKVQQAGESETEEYGGWGASEY